MPVPKPADEYDVSDGTAVSGSTALKTAKTPGSLRPSDGAIRGSSG